MPLSGTPFATPCSQGKPEKETVGSKNSKKACSWRFLPTARRRFCHKSWNLIVWEIIILKILILNVGAPYPEIHFSKITTFSAFDTEEIRT
jgi:hypothetical protein